MLKKTESQHNIKSTFPCLHISHSSVWVSLKDVFHWVDPDQGPSRNVLLACISQETRKHLRVQNFCVLWETLTVLRSFQFFWEVHARNHNPRSLASSYCASKELLQLLTLVKDSSVPLLSCKVFYQVFSNIVSIFSLSGRIGPDGCIPFILDRPVR